MNIYLSHRRTLIDKQDSMPDYHKLGELIRAYLIDWEKMDGMPKVNLYVPYEHKPIIDICIDEKFLTEKDIMYIDSKIISEMDILVVFGSEFDGYQINTMKCAKERGIPIFSMPQYDKMCIDSLGFTIKLVMKTKDK